jgi:hypothetical protein
LLVGLIRSLSGKRICHSFKFLPQPGFGMTATGSSATGMPRLGIAEMNSPQTATGALTLFN